MRAGTLHHLVTLQSLTAGQDAIGGAMQVWTDTATVWADIRYLSGLETVKADAQTDISRCSIRIRWRSGITPGMRVTQGAIVFDVKAVLPDPTGRQWLDLVAETGASLG